MKLSPADLNELFHRNGVSLQNSSLVTDSLSTIFSYWDIYEDLPSEGEVEDLLLSKGVPEKDREKMLKSLDNNLI